MDNNDSGILRRQKMATAPEEEELLIFGYACKLFEDDEKALQVENGDLLVEIEGQKMDRFDGRGILPNLKSCESLPTELKLEEYLSPEEVCVEEMCEDERYRAMKIADEAEELIKKEEAAKRLDAEGAEIGFDYDNPDKNKKTENSNAEPPPIEISLHQMAQLIEKTSEFIATQGAQMSILMRAKEAHNPKFQFLNPGNPYHTIYTQVLEKKKARSSASGRGLLTNLPEVPSIEEVEKSLRNLSRNLPSAAPGQTSSEVSKTTSYSELVQKMKANLPPPPPPPPSLPEPEAKDSKTETVEATSSTKPSAVPASETPKVDDNSVMVQVPSYDDQVLIDQTASYVCRNGGEKLGILRKRMPEKFAFLRSDNKYNTYYQFKVALYHELKAERHREQKAKAVASANAAAAALQDPSKHFPALKGFFR